MSECSIVMRLKDATADQQLGEIEMYCETHNCVVTTGVTETGMCLAGRVEELERIVSSQLWRVMK